MPSSDPRNVILLNVGGCAFVTCRETLHSGYFTGLLQTLGEEGEQVAEVFVDRDPTHFRYVLNWLRGCRYLPEDDQTLTELMWEADFYALDDMISSITATRRRVSSLHTLDAVAASLSEARPDVRADGR